MKPLQRWLIGCCCATLYLFAGTVPAKTALLSDEQVKQQIIEESIAGYSGPCACPYNTARNGSRCGRRSAYSRPGGAQPLCYAGDVTLEQVKQWRVAHQP